jgi:hypothetical protein
MEGEVEKPEGERKREREMERGRKKPFVTKERIDRGDGFLIADITAGLPRTECKARTQADRLYGNRECVRR